MANFFSRLFGNASTSKPSSMSNSVRVATASDSPIGMMATIIAHKGNMPQPNDVLTDETSGKQWRLKSYGFMKTQTVEAEKRWLITLEALGHSEAPAEGSLLGY